MGSQIVNVTVAAPASFIYQSQSVNQHASLFGQAEKLNLRVDQQDAKIHQQDVKIYQQDVKIYQQNVKIYQLTEDNYQLGEKIHQLDEEIYQLGEKINQQTVMIELQGVKINRQATEIFKLGTVRESFLESRMGSQTVNVITSQPSSIYRSASAAQIAAFLRQMEELNLRLDRQDARIKMQDARINQRGAFLHQLEETLNHQGARLNQLDARIDQQVSKIDALGTKIHTVEFDICCWQLLVILRDLNSFFMIEDACRKNNELSIANAIQALVVSRIGGSHLLSVAPHDRPYTVADYHPSESDYDSQAVIYHKFIVLSRFLSSSAITDDLIGEVGREAFVAIKSHFEAAIVGADTLIPAKKLRQQEVKLLNEYLTTFLRMFTDFTV